MVFALEQLQKFLSQHSCVLVKTNMAQGSTPREAGAWMLVSATAMIGTIGGGQLEYIALDNARQLLRNGEKTRNLDVPLGPEIGQCCGGRVGLNLQYVTEDITRDLLVKTRRKHKSQRHVYIMGAGHVGRALATAMAPLPFNTIIVDTRADALHSLPETVEARLSVLPEAEVRSAPQGSVFVVLTHDHALDFLITREALVRGDAAYVGMIGSRTKRAGFVSWLAKEGIEAGFADGLICPIGGGKVCDKRPEVIGALVVTQILVHCAALQEKELLKNRQGGELVGGYHAG